MSWMALIAWIAAHAAHVTLAGRALIRGTDRSEGSGHLSLWISTLAAIVPVITLVLFVAVFVIGQSSNVAQLAGSEGMRLWSLWLGVWPLLLLGNLVSGLASVSAALLPPYSVRTWRSSVSRVCGAVGAGFAWYVVGTYFPDA